MTLILLAPPGGGKGTQADLLSRNLGFHRISLGDILREEVGKKSVLGLQAKPFMERGELVPDELVTQLVLQRILALPPGSGTILDGFPRNIHQARYLDKALGEKKLTIDKVIYMRVSHDELLRRLSSRWICSKCQQPYQSADPSVVEGKKCQRCGGDLYQRPDDTPEAVSRRLEVYRAETAPLIQYYRGREKLVEVAGEGDVEQVNHAIVAALRKQAVHG